MSCHCDFVFIYQIYRPVSYMLPAFHWFFLDPIKEDDLAFQSDHHIKYINCPIVILHAQDDVIIPITLAHKVTFPISSGCFKSFTLSSYKQWSYL